MELISCKNISLGYDGRVVVKNLSFCVNSGDYLCIVGENGSGKSTLMKTVLRLCKPIAGEIVMGEGLRHNEIGYLPQQTEIQKDFPASVWEIVLSGTLNRCGLCPFYKREQKQRARAIMEKVGIADIASRSYRELSGGQQQRVLLARALSAASRLIFLDEPAAGLDPVAMEKMYELINKLNKEDGITVMMISHDIEAAVKYSSHILHIGEEPYFFGTKEEYLESDVGKKYLFGKQD